MEPKHERGGRTHEMELARRMWQAIEPLHAVVYFDPGPAAAAKELGLKGWWMGYFAGRFGPCGAIGAQAATAMAYGFSPAFVARSLPDAWNYASPAEVVAARTRACGVALGGAFEASGTATEAVHQLVAHMEQAVAGCWFEGRPLAAGWAGVLGAQSQSLYEQLWTLTTVLREHRGDGHVLAGVALGLRGLDATVTNIAAGAMPKGTMLPNRGWTDDDWAESVERLRADGWIELVGGTAEHVADDSAGGIRLTAEGVARRLWLENETDRLAVGPIAAAGPEVMEAILGTATPVARHLIDVGAIPIPNPIGVPRP